MSASQEQVSVRLCAAIVNQDWVALSDAGPQAFSGEIEEPMNGDRTRLRMVVGVARPSSVMTVDVDSLFCWPLDVPLPPETAALIPLVGSLIRALSWAQIAPGDRVVVRGSGIISLLAARLASRTSLLPAVMRAEAAGDTGTADVLIDASADPGRWQVHLADLRDRARALLLVPPVARTVPFEFYPHVHRRSLALTVRHVPTVRGWQAHSPRLAEIAAQLLREDTRVREALTAAARRVIH